MSRRIDVPLRAQRLPDVWRRATAADRVDVLLVAFFAITLFARIIVDDKSPVDSRYSGNIDVSAVFAAGFIALALILLLVRRRGILVTCLSALWLAVWTAVAVHTNGASNETLREGVRETSVLAVAVVVYNTRGAFSVTVATRLLQICGVVPAVLALYQMASHTGLDVAGNIRANGTFAHPNSAAMFFAIVSTASLWAFLDGGRRLIDAVLTLLFSASLIATFSIDGLITLAAMLVFFGVTHSGSLRDKLLPCGLAVVVVLVFFATPLGAKRVAGESATSLSAAERGETTSSLDTRLYRWKTLLPEWEESPVLGRGLGTTTTSETTRANRYNSLLPHNEYLRYLVETGVIGLGLLFVGLASLIRGLHRRKSPRRPSNAASLALAVVIGCLVDSLADNTLLNSPTGYAAALVIASVLMLPRGRSQTRDVQIA